MRAQNRSQVMSPLNGTSFVQNLTPNVKLKFSLKIICRYLLINSSLSLRSPITQFSIFSGESNQINFAIFSVVLMQSR